MVEMLTVAGGILIAYPLLAAFNFGVGLVLAGNWILGLPTACATGAVAAWLIAIRAGVIPVPERLLFLF